ncbi:MAG: helix-turn-helix domain-containing protein [Kiritimatiellae bacterium]|nr:helix-turn-helix domain-containing protein [Kiritimatiellia bacterium]
MLRLVDRMSSQNVTGAHRRTARALEVIRAGALSGMGAADVAAAVGVSPRMLEITFRKTLGRTVRDEILRVRLDEVKRLLATTRISIGDVAAKCGFRTPSALKALFSRRFGSSMRGWRARNRIA